MAIIKINKLSRLELKIIKDIIADAFVSNDLFYNWGSEKQRYEDVRKYMYLFVDFVYKAKQLYANESLTAFIALEDSTKTKKFLQTLMLLKMIFKLGPKKLKKILNFVNQVTNSNAQYAKKAHIDCQMLCVKKEYQGTCMVWELIDFAKQVARGKKVPLLVDTDMKRYKEMYEYMGFYCYNSIKASNGVTRYSLIFKE